MGFDQTFLEKTMKIHDFPCFPGVLLLDFAIFPRIPIQTAGPHVAASEFWPRESVRDPNVRSREAKHRT